MVLLDGEIYKVVDGFEGVLADYVDGVEPRGQCGVDDVVGGRVVDRGFAVVDVQGGEVENKED